ncbi:MAG: alkaline phosphatase D family protein [Solirubrobacteraceae bacterium]
MHSRRQFLARSGAASAAVFAPQALMSGLASAKQAPLLKSGKFAEGVASGDPGPKAITLWTRVAELERKGSVRLEVARDKGFRHVVARDRIGTSPGKGGSVKARVTGLKPYEQYFYRFETKDGSSEVGRFRTAPPADSRQELTFAFFSCQDFTHGFYNAHELMAREDIDFSVCLGDYIYAESYHTVAGGTGVRDDDIGATTYDDHPHVATTLGDYRDKYALYRSDKALRKLHQRAPMVVIWDDHEVQNNYAGGDPGGGLPADELYSATRRDAGYRAWFESMPTYGRKGDLIYRRLKFGKTMDLIMLDQRQYRDDQPCDDAVVPGCAELPNPRDLLGRKQMKWAKQQLSSSKAAWKVVGSEVMMMPAKVLGGSYYTFDSWQGYQTEREELLGHIKSRGIDDVVFVTGDIHTFIAGDVRTEDGAGDTVATEFVGGSITSQSLGETNLDAGGGVTIPGNDADPNTPQALIDALRSINPWVDQADFDHHGYGLAKVSRKAFDVTLKRVSTIKQKTTATETADGFRYRVERGQKSIKGVNGPAA